MSLELLSGPSGSGKTGLLLEHARRRCAAGQRVLWIGLPQQRSHLLSRLVQGGGVVGFEFISEQQLCYRLLSEARMLRPLKVGTERLALIGAALAEVQQATPMPGEARLFASAIAELKRNGIDPDGAAGLAFDNESDRLADVYRVYEQMKADAWDYDDYRQQALLLAQRGEAVSGADTIIVSGYRELLPLTTELYVELSRGCEVMLALPEAPRLPAGVVASERQLPAPVLPATDRWRAPNEVEEARWIMRSIKAELAAGTDMNELALVVPRQQLWAYAALADEYGVPLMPLAPRSLTHSRAGHTLRELINLEGEFITPAALLVLPGLEPLAAAALDRRISGRAALLELADRLDEQAAEAEAAGVQSSDPHTADAPVPTDEPEEPGQRQLLERWLSRMEETPPGLAWAEQLVTAVSGELAAIDGDADELKQFAAQAMQRAREAAQLGEGDSFRAWWSALLEDTHLPLRENAGVALLTPDLASGRRYRRAWLAGALEGNYVPQTAEDYFLPEELRSLNNARGVLPRRFAASSQLLFSELQQLADRLTVTYPESSQAGRNTPQPELTGTSAAPPLPQLPAGNRSELGGSFRPSLDHQLEPSLVSLPGPEVQWLMRYAECPHREWTVGLLRDSGDLDPPELADWQLLRRELQRSVRLDDRGIAELAGSHPWAADWLREQAGLLTSLHYGLRLPQSKRTVLKARIDAAGRIDGVFHIYRFSAPEDDLDAEGATELLKERRAERWLADHMLRHSLQPEPLVRLFVWPLLGTPVEAGTPGGQDSNQRWLSHGLGDLDDQLDAYQAGIVAPRPGFHQCSSCPVRDFCRRAAQ